MQERVLDLSSPRTRKQEIVQRCGTATPDLVPREVGADAQTIDPYEGIRMCREFLQRMK